MSRLGMHRGHVGLGAAVLALSFLLTVAYAQQRMESRRISSRRDQLVKLVLDRETRLAGIEKQLLSMHQRIEALDRKASGPLAALEQEIEQLSELSGNRAVKGRGVSVTLADSPQARNESSPDFLIQDVDVQLVVNEIWAAGAEAIAINGERLVSTSAIRSAGKSILVNYKVLTSPYRIDAIGNARSIESGLAGSQIAQRFRRWSQIYQLRMTIQTQSDLLLPAFVETGHRAYVLATP